jgi:hypothetical protein
VRQTSIAINIVGVSESADLSRGWTPTESRTGIRLYDCKAAQRNLLVAENDNSEVTVPVLWGSALNIPFMIETLSW